MQKLLETMAESNPSFKSPKIPPYCDSAQAKNMHQLFYKIAGENVYLNQGQNSRKETEYGEGTSERYQRNEKHHI